MVPLAWNQLPSITLADKQRIIGASPPVPPSKVFDTDLGCPLVWQDVKSKDLWLALLEACQADYVVDSLEWSSPYTGVGSASKTYINIHHHHRHATTMTVMLVPRRPASEIDIKHT